MTVYDEIMDMVKARMDERKQNALAEGKNIGIAEGKNIGIAEGKNIGIAEGKSIGIIEGLINAYRDFDLSKEDATQRIMSKFSYSKEKAAAEVDKYWN